MGQLFDELKRRNVIRVAVANGAMTEADMKHKKLRVEEQLLYLAELKGLRPADAREKVRYWLDRFDARTWGQKKTEELSKGMQQKVQFISTILHDPTLLIFDEPFSGLDPLNAELLRDIILELKDAGRTLLFASHRMEQVEQICDDICLISKGRILLQGPLREIKRSFGRNTVVLEFDGDSAFLDALEQEIARREEAEVALRRHQEQLEEQVAERTIALSTANAELQREIAERAQAEAKRAGLRKTPNRQPGPYNSSFPFEAGRTCCLSDLKTG